MTLSFDKPAVYLITKGEATPDNFDEKRSEILNVVRAAVNAGVTFVQLREKALPARLVYELAAEVATITRGTATRLLVNDRADIATAVGADGVQLTAMSLNAAVVRGAFGPECVIGVSAHSLEEIDAARHGGADFALFGPVFSTPQKENVQGIGALREACDAARPFPVIAIGGIDLHSYESVLDAGAAGFAAIRFLNDIEQLKAARKPTVDG